MPGTINYASGFAGEFFPNACAAMTPGTVQVIMVNLSRAAFCRLGYRQIRGGAFPTSASRSFSAALRASDSESYIGVRNTRSGVVASAWTCPTHHAFPLIASTMT